MQWEPSEALWWSAALCRLPSSLWELSQNSCFSFSTSVWLQSLLQSIIPAWKITRKFSSSLKENCCLKPQSIVLFPSTGIEFKFCSIPFVFVFLSLFSSSNMKRGKIRLKNRKKLKERVGENKSCFFFDFLSWKFLLLEKLRSWFYPHSVSLESKECCISCRLPEVKWKQWLANAFLIFSLVPEAIIDGNKRVLSLIIWQLSPTWLPEKLPVAY